MNYADLCTNLQNTVENEFEAEDLANFFRQAEEDINRIAQFPSSRKNVRAAISSGTQYISLPSDVHAIYSVSTIDSAGDYDYLLLKDVNYMREAYPRASSQSRPQYYAYFGARPDDPTTMALIIGPTADATYSVEIHYLTQPQSVVDAGVTWLSENAPGALLNGALIYAARFLKSDADTVKLYLDMFNQSITLLKDLGDGKMRHDAYRSGQVTNPVK